MTFCTQFSVLGTFRNLQKQLLAMSCLGVHTRNNLECHEIWYI